MSAWHMTSAYPVQIGLPKAKARKALTDACKAAGYGRGWAKEVRSDPNHVEDWTGHLLTLDDLAGLIRSGTDNEGRPIKPGDEWTIWIYETSPHYIMVNHLHIEMAAAEGGAA